MALDPSIALQGNKVEAPDIGKIIGNVTNIKAQQAQTATTEAALPGVQAESDLKVRAAAFKKWQTDNAKNFVTIDSSGAKKLDHTAFVNDAANAGFWTEAQAVAASDLANDQAAQSIKTSGIANADSIRDYTKKAMGHAATLVAALPPEQQAAKWDQYAQFADSHVPGTGALFGKYSPENIAAVKDATMTPLEKANLNLNQAEQEKQFAEASYSPEGKNVNSTTSKLAQDRYLAANPGFPEAEVRKMSAFQIQTLDKPAGSVGLAESGSRLSADQRIGAEATANDLAGAQAALNKGADAAAQLRSKYPTIVGQRISEWFKSKIVTDGDKQVMRDAIQEYEKREGKKIDDDAQFSGIENLLRQGSKNLTPKIKTATNISTKSKVSATGTPSGADKTEATTGTVRVRSPDGKIGTIPREDLQEALSAGYKQVK